MFIANGGQLAPTITTGALTPSDGLDGGKLGITTGGIKDDGECSIPDGDQVITSGRRRGTDLTSIV